MNMNSIARGSLLSLMALSLLGGVAQPAFADTTNTTNEAHQQIPRFVDGSNGVVGNTDDRVIVDDTTKAPYNSVVNVHSTIMGGLYGWADTAGIVVGENMILVNDASPTATKTLFEQPDKFVVTPGRQGETAPFGDFKIKEVKFDGTGNTNYKILILEKNDKGQNIGDVISPVKLNPSTSDTDFIGDSLQFVGYAYRTDVDQSKPIEYQNILQKTSWGTQLEKDDEFPDKLWVSTDIGSQGRGVLLDEDKNLVAMFGSTGVNPYPNPAARLTMDVYNWINDVMAENK